MPNASSTAFPGRTSASTATPRPTSAKRPTEGANAALVDEQRPAREGRGEHRLARELVEHQGVALVDEQRRGDGDVRPAAPK